MGRPCTCCGDDCQAKMLTNFVFLDREEDRAKNIEDIESRRLAGEYVDPFELFTKDDKINNSIPAGANKLQWDVIRGNPILSPPLTPMKYGWDIQGQGIGDEVDRIKLLYHHLYFGYTETSQGVIALHKVPMSTSKDTNILRFDLRSSQTANEGYGATNDFFNYLHFDERGAVGGGITQRGYSEQLPNGIQIGDKRIWGDYLFFADRRSGANFADGWSFRIEATAVDNVVDTQMEVWSGTGYIPTYEIAFKLFNERGVLVNERIIYSITQKRTYEDFTIDDYSWTSFTNKEQEYEQNNWGNYPKEGFIESFFDKENQYSFDDVSEDISLDGVNGLNDPFPSFCRLYIEDRCGSDAIDFFIKMGKENTYETNHVDNPLKEFHLFSHDIPKANRPGNLWGFKQPDQDYVTIPSRRQDAPESAVLVPPETYLNYNFNSLAYRGFVIGSGESSSVDGEKFDIDLWNTLPSKYRSGDYLDKLCDPCFTSSVNNGWSPIPAPVYKIEVSNYPTEPYTFVSAGCFLYFGWDKSYGTNLDVAGLQQLYRSSRLECYVDWTPGEDINGTYYIGPDFVGCPDNLSKQKVCGVPNILLNLDGGSFNSFEVDIDMFRQFGPDLYSRGRALTSGTIPFRIKTDVDFFLTPGLIKEQSTIQYERQVFGDPVWSEYETRQENFRWRRSILDIDNSNDIITRTSDEYWRHTDFEYQNIVIDHPVTCEEGGYGGFHLGKFGDRINLVTWSDDMTEEGRGKFEGKLPRPRVGVEPTNLTQKYLGVDFCYSPIERAEIKISRVSDYGE